MTSVTVVDYGAGNLFSVTQVLQHCGAEAKLATSPKEILNAEKIILPGVGAFGKAIDKIKYSGFDEALRQFAASSRPLLGICLGMQLLFDSSNEHGTHEGLGLIPGAVMEIPATGLFGEELKRTHIGWADLKIDKQSLLFEAQPISQAAYFVHSFTAQAAIENTVATVDYHGHSLTAAVARENVFGVQFHPEKSSQFGINFIRRFIENL